MKILKIFIGLFLFWLITHLALSAYFHPEPVSFEDRYDYAYNSHDEIDSFETADGFVAYTPSDFNEDSIPLIVFIHGWGAHNPIAYGAWIEHLIRQGYAVIFPRYQCSLLTSPADFTDNAANGIRRGIKSIEKQYGYKLQTDKTVFIGHSFGGVISVNLSIKAEELGIPRPKGVMAVQPGHGPMESGRIDDYDQFPANTKLLLVTGENDHITEDKFAKEIYELNKDRVDTLNWLMMYADKNGEEKVKAVHEDPLAMHPAFDKGTGFLVIFRAKMVNRLDHADFNGFWKLADGLTQCVFYNQNCNQAFGGTEQQKDMGTWEDGTEVKDMEVRM